MAIFKAISEDSNHEWSFIDGTIVEAHQQSSAARNECDSELLRAEIAEQDAFLIISRKENLKIGNQDMDGYRYKYRHLVEKSFARLKYLKLIATRYDFIKASYITWKA